MTFDISRLSAPVEDSIQEQQSPGTEHVVSPDFPSSPWRTGFDPARLVPQEPIPQSAAAARKPFQPNKESLRSFYAFAVRDIADEETKKNIAQDKDLARLAGDWKDDPRDKTMLGMRLATALFGYEHNDEPAIYWQSQGKEVPALKDKTEGYRTMWEEWSSEQVRMQQAINTRRQTLEQRSVELEQLVESFVSGWETNIRPSQMRYLEETGIQWESLQKARRAFSHVKDYTTAIDSYDEKSLDAIYRELSDDAAAQRIFLNIYAGQRKKNARSGMEDLLSNPVSSTALGTALGAKRTLNRSWRYLNHGEPERMQLDGVDASRMAEVMADSEEQYKRQVDRERFIAEFVGIAQMSDDDLLGDHTPGMWSSGIWNGMNKMMWDTGQIAGETAPILVPGIGAAQLFTSTAQARMDEGLALGLDYEEAQKRSGLFGTSDTLQELIEYSALGKVTRGGKLINRLAGRFAPTSRLATKYLGSRWLQYGAATGAGILEEGVVEPSAGYLMNQIGNLYLTDERGKYYWEHFMNDLKSQWADPGQVAALAIFSGGMSATSMPHIARQANEFVQSLDGWKSIGGTEAQFHEARRIEDPEERLRYLQEKARENWQQDPEGAYERSKDGSANLASREEVAALRDMESFRAMQDLGMLPRFEQAEEEGKYRVYDHPEESESKITVPAADAEKAVETQESNASQDEQGNYTVMTSEQLEQYLRINLTEQTRGIIRDVQNLMAGDATTEALSKRGLIVSDIKTPDNVRTLRALARHALASVRAFESSGMTREEALRQIDPSVDRHMTLEGAIRTYSAFKDRNQTALRRGEIKPGQSTESNAYVVRDRSPKGGMRSILRYARGRANVVELWEETMEQAVLDYCRDNGIDIRDFGGLLQNAQRVLNEEYGGEDGEQFINLDAVPDYHDCVEAVSALGKSRILADASSNTRLPSWLRKLVDYMLRFMDMFRSKVALGESLKKMEADGKLTKPIMDLIGRMTESVEDLYADNAEINVQQYLDEAIERQRRQAELDALLGDGVASEPGAVEETLEILNREQEEDEEDMNEAEQQAFDSLASAHEENGERLSEDEIARRKDAAQRDRDSMQVDVLGDADTIGTFTGGVCIPVSEGVYQGFVPTDKLTLSKDVPQFKKDADSKWIVNPLVGSWRRDAPPISVWMRKNGSLEVISGRHRFGACKEQGIQDIQAVVYVENDEHTLEWAKRLDVENNIRDGQATMYEIARYIKETQMTREAAAQHGIARRGTSMKGLEVGLYASQELMDALGNGQIGEDHAYRIAMAFKNDSEIQRTGIGVLADGGTIHEAYNAMAAKAALQQIARENQSAGMSFETDLFGNTDTEELYKRIGSYAAKRYQELGRELNAINGASKNPALARKYGIDVNDPESIRKAADGIRELRSKWKNFAVHPDLLREANNAVMEEMGLKPEDGIDAMLSLPRKQEKPGATFSVTIASNDVCRTRQEAIAKVGRQGKPVHLENRFLSLDALFNAKSEGKFSQRDSLGRTINFLSREGIAEDKAKEVHFTAFGNIRTLFANAERMKFERAYKKQHSRKGFLHVYSPFDIEGFNSNEFEANIELEIHQNKELKPTAYLLSVTIQKRPQAVLRSGPLTQGESQSSDVLVAESIQTEFPDIVKPQDDVQSNFSIIGENADVFGEYLQNGLTYMDPVDGKRKAILDARGVKLTRKIFSVPFRGLVRSSLAAALDYPELYRAYPDLRNYTVHFYNDDAEGWAGYCNAKDHYIAVNVAYGQDTVLDTLLHEVQHVIQAHEGFSRGAGFMDKSIAMDYVSNSINQLKGRNDEWAKEAIPRLEKMFQLLDDGSLNPMYIYYASHGEKEARLAGSFSQGSVGPSMAGMDGNSLIQDPASVPLTGDITELGGITFDKGRFGHQSTNVFSPQGDWLYDTTVFRIRAALERVAKRVESYGENVSDNGLALYAEASELVSAAEKYLPASYGFGLEPYRIWLDVFSSLYGTGDIDAAIAKVPMRGWPEIMRGSFLKAFRDYVFMNEDLNAEYETIEEELKQTPKDEKSPLKDTAMERMFMKYGKDFLTSYGQMKTRSLVSKFMERVVDQIDKFRKDKTLGQIRRVVSTIRPKRIPGEKPVKGKMESTVYHKLETYVALMNMTSAEYEDWFEKNFPEEKEEEGDSKKERYEDVPPERTFVVNLYNDEGKLTPHEVTKQEMEAYACYDNMSVNAAERCGKALGEFISTGRNAWQNAEEARRLELEALVSPIREEVGSMSPAEIASMRDRESIRKIPRNPLSVMECFTNLGQQMDIVAKKPLFREFANSIKQRSADASVLIEKSEYDRLAFIANTIVGISGKKDKYNQAKWINTFRQTHDTGITITEQEPDWKARARKQYRESLLRLLQRKVRTHGRDAMKPYLGRFKLDNELKQEVMAKYGRSLKKLTPKQREKALEHINRVFTDAEWTRYGSQEKYIETKAAKLRGQSSWANEKKKPKSYKLDNVSRDQAAYIVMLSEQDSYKDWCLEQGFTEDVIEQLKKYIGDDGMQLAYSLRNKLNERSHAIQDLCEKRYGAPFPLEKNYFRAFFDAQTELKNQDIAEGTSFGNAAAGGTYAITRTRKKHHARPDLQIGVTTAFQAAMREQDIFIHCSEISRDMRAFLNYSKGEFRMHDAILKIYGKATWDRLSEWCNALDRTGVNYVRGALEADKLFTALANAGAEVLLSWRISSYAKQFTAITNSLYGDDNVTFAEWMSSLGRVIKGTAVVGVPGMMEKPELYSRDKTRFAVLQEALSAPNNVLVSRLRWFSKMGMNNMERLDVWSNAVASAVLYDATYRRLAGQMDKKDQKANHEQLDQAALASVRQYMETKAQPINHRQRSLAAQNKMWLMLGPMYLAGESINTSMRVYSLIRQRHYGKAASLYLANGLVLTLMQMLLDFFTDDEDRRKQRSWRGYLSMLLSGPLSGVPLISSVIGEAWTSVWRAAGAKDAYFSTGNSMVPFADLGKLWHDMKKIKDVADPKKPWQDRAMALDRALQATAAIVAGFSMGTTKGKAAVAGTALTTGAAINLMEFILKTERSIESWLKKES